MRREGDKEPPHLSKFNETARRRTIFRTFIKYTTNPIIWQQKPPTEFTSTGGFFPLPLITDHCSLDLPRNRRHLQLTNRLRDLDLARADQRTVEGGVTARDARSLTDDVQSLGGRLVAAVEDKAVRRHQRGGTEIIVTGPERRAGGGATRAQDAFRGFIEAGALFDALPALLPVRGKRGLVDEIRQDLLVIIEERVHVHDQVFDDLQAQQRLDGDVIANVAHQNLAGQIIAPVDTQRIRAAHAVRARTAEGERAIVIALHLFEQVEHAVGLFPFEGVFLVVGFRVHFGVVTENFQCYQHRRLTNKHALWVDIS
jgi:hypothetical protein